MPGKILCSTGTIIGRRNGFNHRLIEKYLPEIKSDGFELMLYEIWYERLKSVTDDFKSAELPIATLHEDKQIGELISRNNGDDYFNALERHRINCEAAAKLGAGLLVLHLWNGVPSDKNIEFNIDAFGRLNDIARSYSLELTVENVICNKKSPLIHLNELADRYSDVKFTFDTKMAAFHGELEKSCECERLWKENRIAHVHVNDYAGGYMDWSDLKVRHIGEGNVNFCMFFDVLKKYSYNGNYTIECSSMNEDGSIMTDKLNSSIEKVRSFISR